MRKLSESILDDVILRSKGKTERKEDRCTFFGQNTDCKVVEGQYNWDQAVNKAKDYPGWRIPTYGDILNAYGKKPEKGERVMFNQEPDGRKIWTLVSGSGRLTLMTRYMEMFGWFWVDDEKSGRPDSIIVQFGGEDEWDSSVLCTCPKTDKNQLVLVRDVIDESVLDDVISRSKGNRERKEDRCTYFGPDRDCKFYKEGDRCLFTYAEALEIAGKNPGWRIPSPEDFREPARKGSFRVTGKRNRWHGTFDLETGKDGDFMVSKYGSMLVPRNGCGREGEVIDYDETYFWLDGEYREGKETYAYSMNVCPKSMSGPEAFISLSVEDCMFQVLLIRDRVDESILDDVISRSKGKTEREEDKIHWLDFGDEFDCLWADRLYDGGKKFSREEAIAICRKEEAYLPEGYNVKKLKCVCLNGTMTLGGSKTSISFPYEGREYKDHIWYEKGCFYFPGFGNPITRLEQIGAENPLLLVKAKNHKKIRV